MTVWPDPPPDGTGLKSWREESNLRSPGYQPGVLTAVLRQGMKILSEQGRPELNGQHRFWRPACSQLHHAPIRPRQSSKARWSYPKNARHGVLKLQWSFV